MLHKLSKTNQRPLGWRYIKECFSEKAIDCEDCVKLCTDGPAIMPGCRLGVVEEVKEVARKELFFTQCTIHLEQRHKPSLAAKKLM